jgi:hypothetical protein
MLQDLERLFCKSGSSLSKFGFPMPGPVLSELDVEKSRWCNDAEIEQQRSLLINLNTICPNNQEQEVAYNHIMQSIHEFTTNDRESLTRH